MNIDLIIILLFLATTLMVSIIANKQEKTVKDYALGGRSYATSILAAAMFTTWIGGQYCQGLAERIFSSGLIFLAIFLCGIISKIIIAKFIAPRIEPLYGLISAGEVMGKFYGKLGQISTGTSGLLLSIGYVAAAVAGIGYLCQSLLGLNQNTSTLIAGIIVIGYSTYGGMRANTITNSFHFIVLVIAMPIIVTAGLNEIGGYSNLINSIPQSHLQIVPNNSHPLEILFLFIIFSMPFLDPAVTQRLLMTQNKEQIASATLISTLIEVPFYLIVALISMMTLQLKPDLDPNLSIAYLIDTLLPAGFKGLAIAGIMGAIMSTAKSYLNAASIALVHDVLNPLRKNALSDKSELKFIKAVTLALGIVSIYFAMNVNSIISTILQFLAFWAPVVGVPYIAGIFGIKVATRGLLATAVIGISTNICWNVFQFQQTLHISSLGPSVLASAIVFFVSYKLPKVHFNIRDFARFYRILDSLTLASKERVQKFGAQYVVFGIFGLVNYSTPIFMWAGTTHNLDSSVVLLRLISGVLCLLLIMKDGWPSSLRKYLPLYWHATLTYCLPFLTTYMLIANNGEQFWLLNMSLALLLLAILVDWATFVITLPIGIALACLCYTALNQDMGDIFIGNDLYLACYICVFAMSIGIIFTRNNARTANKILEAKNLLNQKLQETVEERTLDLREALSAKKEFLWKMSHEVRTPLHGIVGGSKELSANWEKLDEPTRNKLANTVISNSDRLVSLMNNVLDLSQFISGKKEMKLEQNVTIVSLAEGAINAGKALASTQHKDLEFRLEVDTNSDTNVEADKNRLAQVFLNLLTNAVQYSDHGTIVVKIDANPKNIKVSISDEGVGIPEQELLTIFEPFIQSSRTKDPSKGTGLGLAFCREVIQLHQGQIWAENTQKAGSTISFYVPRQQSIVSAVIETVPQIKLAQPAIQPSVRGRILIVDDEEVCLQMASLYLESIGCQVVTASGGRAALKYLRDHKNEIDLIFLDLMMPDMYGLAVLSAVKSDPTLKHIPVIIQSGLSDPGEIAKSTELGAAGYIPKPYIKEKITAAIYDALGHNDHVSIAS